MTVGRIRALARSRTVRSLSFAAALLLVVGGVAVSLRRDPRLLLDADPAMLALVLLLGVPATLYANALRYFYTARLVGGRVSLRRALQVTTLSTAANMLPLPGGTLVRLGALSADTDLRTGTQATLLATVLWVAVTLLVAGAGTALVNPRFGHAVLLAGAGGVAAVLLLLRVLRFPRLELRQFAPLLLVELASALVDAGRVLACLWAVGVAAQLPQATALILASVAGSAASVVPAGLGVRELVSAMLGPLVDLAPEACFVSATINRIVGLLGIVPVAAWFFWRERRGGDA